jgi:hypothetical protein
VRSRRQKIPKIDHIIICQNNNTTQTAFVKIIMFTSITPLTALCRERVAHSDTLSLIRLSQFDRPDLEGDEDLHPTASLLLLLLVLLLLLPLPADDAARDSSLLECLAYVRDAFCYQYKIVMSLPKVGNN